MAVFNASFQNGGDFSATFNGNAAFTAGMAEQVVIEVIEGEIYDGEYEITPADSTQILETKNMVLIENITINPIPNNYGLITWNGSVLTVS